MKNRENWHSDHVEMSDNLKLSVFFQWNRKAKGKKEEGHKGDRRSDILKYWYDDVFYIIWLPVVPAAKLDAHRKVE